MIILRQEDVLKEFSKIKKEFYDNFKSPSIGIEIHEDLYGDKQVKSVTFHYDDQDLVSLCLNNRKWYKVDGDLSWGWKSLTKEPIENPYTIAAGELEKVIAEFPNKEKKELAWLIDTLRK